MITITLIFVTFAVFFLSICLENVKVFRASLVLAVITVWLFVYSSNSGTEIKKTSYLQLENLKDGAYIQGEISMFLGSGDGKIEQNFYYTMYYRGKDGIKFLRLPVDKCVIVYSEDRKLEIEQIKYIRPDGWFAKYFWVQPKEPPPHYIIKVPQGTIDNKFELDAK